jgi:hypothetical protein
MLSLGYSEYVTQGGDWGRLVRFSSLPHLLMRPNSSTIFPVDTGLGIPVRSSTRQGFAYQLSSVRRFRLPTTSQSPVILTHHYSPTDSAAPILFWKNPIQYVKHLITPYTPREREGLALYKAFQTQGHGYYAVQSTRPQTLGYSLADSPVGMLAWIYEKLVQWTDSYPWTDEEGVYPNTERRPI